MIIKLRAYKHNYIKSKSTVTNLLIYVNSITVCVSSQGQTYSVYFDLIRAFDKIPHTLLVHELSNFGLSDCYINWFQGYLPSRFCVVRNLGNPSSPFPMLSGVPQGSTLGSFLFIIFINYSRDKIHFFEFLFFVDDLKIFRAIKSSEDCKLLQSELMH
jgi:hypothetical protein